MSIAELMVASGILALALVTVMVLFGQLIRNTNKNSLLSAGAFFADSILEREITMAKSSMLPGQNSTPAFSPTRFPLVSEGFLSTAADSPETKYLYEVTTEHLTGFSNTEPGQSWFITVEVRWWQDSMAGESKSRAGSGKLNIKRGKMVYLFADGR